MFVMDFQQNKPAVNAAGLFSFRLLNPVNIPSVLRSLRMPLQIIHFELDILLVVSELLAE
jgi:hypothetical protein